MVVESRAWIPRVSHMAVGMVSCGLRENSVCSMWLLFVFWVK